MKRKGWFKIKAYPHIGLPLLWKDKKEVCSYIKNPDKIASHAFLPFIHKQIISRKYRKQYDSQGNILNSGKREVLKPKVRDIYYACSFDSNVYSYYAFILGKKYEQKLRSNGISECVTAYRKVRLNNASNSRNKCNIDFANDVFNFIKESEFTELAAIAFDIEGFFDNLNHAKLKNAWCSLIDTDTLPKDHYNVYKSITKFSYVEENLLFNLFKDSLFVRNISGVYKQKSVDKLHYCYDQKVVAFCELEDIHIIRKNGLIISSKRKDGVLRNSGICQGSPISAMLANIYMFDFDFFVQNEVSKLNGMYRRYSDDMVVIVPLKHKDEIIEMFREKIQSITDLNIQDTKTQVFQFIKKNRQWSCLKEFDDVVNGNSKNHKFEYLGFSFDGNSVLLKSSSLAKYYRKMKRNVRRCRYYSGVINNNTRGQIFKRRLYKRFSYIGSLRAKKYERVKGTTNEWRETDIYNWGNYITYAKLAENVFQQGKIKHQIRNHWNTMNLYIGETVK